MMTRAMVYVGLPHDVQVMAKYGVTQSDHDQILTAVCVGLRVELKAVLGRNRMRPLVEARQIAFYLMRQLSGLTLTQIGEIFGRDHSTVIYGINTVNDLLKVDVPFQKKVHYIKSLL